MRILLLLFLCLSVLLSGCMTMGTAAFKPEPESAGDWGVRILGGAGDLGISAGVWYMVAMTEFGSSPGERIGILMVALLFIPATIVGLDFLFAQSLPYRKAYYQEKEEERQEIWYD